MPRWDILGGSTKSSLYAVVTRERLTNDVLNTSVMSALIGGFALENMSIPDERTPFDVPIYLLATIAVHACTCSALTSAFIYRIVNNMEDDAVQVSAALTQGSSEAIPHAAHAAVHHFTALCVHRLSIPQGWCKTYWWVVKLPIIKFAMGCISYMASVIVLSYRDLSNETAYREIAMGIGLMSVSSVGFIQLVLVRSATGAPQPGAIKNSKSQRVMV